jgi:hypothetical protein
MEGYTANGEKSSALFKTVPMMVRDTPSARFYSPPSTPERVMSSDKPLRRLPLRQLLASSDKVSRELHELVHTHFVQRITDCRDLSRPVRRRSHYPTMLALQNGLRRFQEAHEQVQTLMSSLSEHLDAIRDHAQREQTARR